MQSLFEKWYGNDQYFYFLIDLENIIVGLK